MVFKLPLADSAGAFKFRSNNAAAVIVDPTSLRAVRLARIVAMETGLATVVVEESAGHESSLATVAKQLPGNCTSVALLLPRHAADDCSDEGNPEFGAAAEQALELALAGRNIELLKPDSELCQLKGLSLCWFSGLDELLPGRPLWHPRPPPCSQQVTHSPSWRLINERLARRMRRHEAGPEGESEAFMASTKAAGGGRGTAIVAEMGPHLLTIDRIDAGANKEAPSSRRLLSEPILGYRNLLGLAHLGSASLSAPPARHGDGTGAKEQQKEESLAGFLALAADGSLSRLDLTIGDLLPAESVYGQYDLNAAVFTLGKLHDLRSLEELKPSHSDIAASLSYAFIKTFFDTLVHAASAHGVPRVIVSGEFFDSAACRDRLMEVWNFAGIPKDALEMHFLRADCENSLALIGGLLQ